MNVSQSPSGGQCIRKCRTAAGWGGASSHLESCALFLLLRSPALPPMRGMAKRHSHNCCCSLRSQHCRMPAAYASDNHPITEHRDSGDVSRPLKTKVRPEESIRVHCMCVGVHACYFSCFLACLAVMQMVSHTLLGKGRTAIQI